MNRIIDVMFAEILSGSLNLVDAGALHVFIRFKFQSTLIGLKKARAATLYAIGESCRATTVHTYKTFYGHGGVIDYRSKKEEQEDSIPTLTKLPADRLINALMEACFMWHSSVHEERSGEMDNVLKDLWERAVVLNSGLALGPNEFYPNHTTIDPAERKSVPLSANSRFQSGKLIHELYQEELDEEDDEDHDDHINICSYCRVTSLHQGVTDTAELTSKWKCMCVSSFMGTTERTTSSSAPSMFKKKDSGVEHEDFIESVAYNRDCIAEKASIVQRWHFISNITENDGGNVVRSRKIMSIVNRVMQKIGLK